MRILLADDEVRVRFALRVLLRQLPYIEIAGEATRASELVEALARVHPDVVLLDWELPGSSGPQTLDDMRSQCPRLSVVALSGSLDARREALAAGATTFICKTDPPDRLLSVIEKFRDALSRPGLPCLAV